MISQKGFLCELCLKPIGLYPQVWKSALLVMIKILPVMNMIQITPLPHPPPPPQKKRQKQPTNQTNKQKKTHLYSEMYNRILIEKEEIIILILILI